MAQVNRQLTLFGAPADPITIRNLEPKDMAIRTRPPQPSGDTPPPEPTPEDAARFADLVESHRWHFARTMAAIPHSYTRRREWATGDWGDGSPGDLDFVWAARFVQTYGTPRPFFSKTFVYYDLGEHEYWTMGADPFETEIINRAERK